MILVDRALDAREKAGKPVRVALFGAGFLGSGIAQQINQSTPGMRVRVVVARDIEKARKACLAAGFDAADIKTVGSAADVDRLGDREVGLTDDIRTGASAGTIDVVVEATGAVDYGAAVALAAVENGKHIVLGGAELDGTLAPILKVYADRAGVVLTSIDGDQPGVTMNLHRYVSGLGLKPVLCGNIKGFQNRYRTPETQVAFAANWGINPRQASSFCDGSKIAFEQAVTANGTGMGVGVRGMFGPEAQGRPVEEVASLYPAEAMLAGNGIVDYVLGAEPGPGIFVIATAEHDRARHTLRYLKMGEGPFYVFHTPFHLCHMEIPASIARAALFRDATLAPVGAPTVDVVATAKTDLAPGDLIDDYGGYKTYGLIENHAPTRRDRLLPMGLAVGCRMKRAVAKDTVLTFDDVELPKDRLADRLRREQDLAFPVAKAPAMTRRVEETV